MHSSSPGRVGTPETLDAGVVEFAAAATSGPSPTRPGDPRERCPRRERHDGRCDGRDAFLDLALRGVRPRFVASARRGLPAAPGRVPPRRAGAPGGRRAEPGRRALAPLGDRIDLDEVATVYLPLAGLLALHVSASRR